MYTPDLAEHATAGMSTPLDPTKQSYATLQKQIIQDQAAVAVPYVQTYPRALTADVQGYVDNPAYPNVVFFHDLKPAS